MEQLSRSNEMLYARRTRLLATIRQCAEALIELEKNLANPIGATPSTKCELEESRIWFEDRLAAANEELTYIDEENRE